VFDCLHYEHRIFPVASELEVFGEFVRDVYLRCEQQNVPVDTAVAGNDIAQFEINLLNTSDGLKAADDARVFGSKLRSAGPDSPRAPAQTVAQGLSDDRLHRCQGVLDTVPQFTITSSKRLGLTRVSDILVRM